MAQHHPTCTHTSNAALPKEEYAALVHACGSYEERMRKATMSDRNIPESVLLFPSQEKAVQLAAHFRTKGMKVCVVIGIGGSSLGTKAVYEALKEDANTTLLFIESVDPEKVRLVLESISVYQKAEEIVCAIVSKSGETLETRSAAHTVVDMLREKFGSVIDKNIVAISDINSPLTHEAQKKGWHTLFIPRHIGGRFSVLTAVGAFPLACAGIDIEKVIAGARGASTSFREREADSARRRAVELYTAYQSGTRVLSIFIFDSRLHAFGVWYQALLAESVGKDEKGILPIVMKGSEDLHALGQYLYDGSNIVSTHMFSTKRDVDILSGDVTLGMVHDAITDAFLETYTAKNRLCAKTHMAQGVTPQSVGELLAEQMITVMILGYLFGVNTFDQPGVEAYKERAREIMATHSTNASTG
jgi:glucose-6-phosphate isomerase